MVDSGKAIREILLLNSSVTSLLQTDQNSNPAIYVGNDLPEHFDPNFGPAILISRRGGQSHAEITALANTRVQIKVAAAVEKYLLAFQVYQALFAILQGVNQTGLDGGTTLINSITETTAAQEMSDPDTGWCYVIGFWNVLATDVTAVGPAGGTYVPDSTVFATTASVTAAVAVETTRAEAAEAVIQGELNGLPLIYDAYGAALTETTRAEAAEALLAPKASPILTGTVEVAPQGVATGIQNYGSGLWTLAGSYYSSGVLTDVWTFQDVLGTGATPTNTLVISHSGSSGMSTVQIPGGLQVGNNYLNEPGIISLSVTNNPISLASAEFVNMNSVLGITAFGSNPAFGTFSKVVSLVASGTQSGDFYGVFGNIQNTAAGSLTNAYALVGRVDCTNSGVIALAVGLLASTPVIATGGTIVTAIGVYITSQAESGVTTAYGIKQVGTSDTNLFAGISQFTGSITVPTKSALDNSTNAASTAYADAAVGGEKARALAAEALLVPKTAVTTGTAGAATIPGIVYTETVNTAAAIASAHNSDYTPTAVGTYRITLCITPHATDASGATLTVRPASANGASAPTGPSGAAGLTNLGASQSIIGVCRVPNSTFTNWKMGFTAPTLSGVPSTGSWDISVCIEYLGNF